LTDISVERKLNESSVAAHSPSRKVLLYGSGSVSKIFFTHKEDELALSHHKKDYKELL